MTRWRRDSRLVAVAAAALLGAVPAKATVVPLLRLEDLANQAGMVVHGRVLRHWSAWDASGAFIWTHYVLEIKDTLKGPAPSAVTISEPGGAVEGVVMEIAGVTRFADQEEVVVFLHRTPIGYWRTYGYGQGKFTVVPAEGRGRLVRTNLAGLVLLDRSPAPGRPLRAAASPLRKFDGMEFDEFRNAVRKALRTTVR